MSNLQLIEDYQRLIWHDQDTSAIEKYFHPDAVINSPIKKTQGITYLKEVIQNWHIGFPNLKVFWDDFICQKDQVVARWHAKGCHEGNFLGISATNKNISYTGVTIYQLENNKVIQYWAFVDMDHIKKQLGQC